MIYLKNPLCLGMEESEYKEMLALGGMRQKHFEKNEVILSAGCSALSKELGKMRDEGILTTRKNAFTLY